MDEEKTDIDNKSINLIFKNEVVTVVMAVPTRSARRELIKIQKEYQVQRNKAEADEKAELQKLKQRDKAAYDLVMQYYKLTEKADQIDFLAEHEEMSDLITDLTDIMSAAKLDKLELQNYAQMDSVMKQLKVSIDKRSLNEELLKSVNTDINSEFWDAQNYAEAVDTVLRFHTACKL